jgi:hypothetical protein
VKSVLIFQLDPATLHALAAGEPSAASPVPLTDHLAGPDHRPLWRRRSRQIADPAPVGQQWDGEDGPETGYERPA